MIFETTHGIVGDKDVTVIDTIKNPDDDIKGLIGHINGNGTHIIITKPNGKTKEIVLSGPIVRASRGNQELIGEILSVVMGGDENDLGLEKKETTELVDNSHFGQLKGFFREHFGSSFSLSDVVLSAILDYAWDSITKLPGLTRLRGVNQHVAVVVVAVGLMVGKVIYDSVNEKNKG